jgi:hypothetical protein
MRASASESGTPIAALPALRKKRRLLARRSPAIDESAIRTLNPGTYP